MLSGTNALLLFARCPVLVLITQFTRYAATHVAALCMEALLAPAATAVLGGEAQAPVNTGVPITVVNYSQWAVHATAIAIPESEIASRLGVPAGRLEAAHSRQRVSSASTIRVNMEPNGGHLMILEARG
jgi:hypothetical protein